METDRSRDEIRMNADPEWNERSLERLLLVLSATAPRWQLAVGQSRVLVYIIFVIY